MSLSFSLSPFKATYLKSDRVNLNVTIHGGDAGSSAALDCKLSPSSLGRIQGKKLALAGAGKGQVSCCVGEVCKTRKIMVLDSLIDEF